LAVVFATGLVVAFGFVFAGNVTTGVGVVDGVVAGVVATVVGVVEGRTPVAIFVLVLVMSLAVRELKPRNALIRMTSLVSAR
jgi:hypothetical protein